MYFHIFQCQTLHLYVVDCEDYYIPYGGSDWFINMMIYAGASWWAAYDADYYDRRYRSGLMSDVAFFVVC